MKHIKKKILTNFMYIMAVIFYIQIFNSRSKHLAIMDGSGRVLLVPHSSTEYLHYLS